MKNLCKAFANKSSTDIKLSKTHLSKLVQSGRFLGRLFGPLLKTGLPLIKNGTTTLVISNDEMKDTIEIVKYLKDSGLLFKGVCETIQNEVKEQRGGFLSMLLNTLGASLLGNILAGKGINRVGEGIVRAGYENKKGRKAPTKSKWDF